MTMITENATQTKEAVEKYMEEWGGDGHTIILAQSLVEMGFTRDFVARFARNHRSGEGCKATIYDTKTGNPFKSCYGVYSLDFSYAIAKDIGADMDGARKKMGRGFQAQELAKAISIRLDELVEIKNQESGEFETVDASDGNHPMWKE